MEGFLLLPGGVVFSLGYKFVLVSDLFLVGPILCIERLTRIGQEGRPPWEALANTWGRTAPSLLPLRGIGLNIMNSAEFLISMNAPGPLVFDISTARLHACTVGFGRAPLP